MAPKDTATRQREYYERHLKVGTADRIVFVVPASTKSQLARLARHRGCTQREIVIDLLAKAEAAATRRMAPTALKAYFDGEITG